MVAGSDTVGSGDGTFLDFGSRTSRRSCSTALIFVTVCDQYPNDCRRAPPVYCGSTLDK
jgi:hypothetical protein